MNERGFMTFELLLATAIAAAFLCAGVAAGRANAYWMLSARDATEAVGAGVAGAASTQREAAVHFADVGAAFLSDDASCASTDTCDGVMRTVRERTPCAKDAVTVVRRALPGYPAHATRLQSTIVDAAALAAAGGDCPLSVPDVGPEGLRALRGFDLGATRPTGLDALDGVIYMSAETAPYLRIVTSEGPVAFANGFVGDGPFQDVDVVREPASGRVLAFVAALAPQFEIIDVTDASRPFLVAARALSGVTLTGAQASGWRVRVYGGRAYVAARYMLAASPELHVFDVRDAERPFETLAYKASTSFYAMIVREQTVGGRRRRLLYAGTTFPNAELKVFDVTDASRFTPLATCDLPGAYQVNALAFLGTTLYAGRDNVPSGGDDLYAFDAADPTSAGFCAWTLRTDVGTDVYSRHVQSMRAAGSNLFVATSNTTGAHGQVQVRDAATLLIRATFEVPLLAENALDIDDIALYAAGTGAPHALTLAPL